MFGEAGVGKSRLAAEAVEEARKRDWQVATRRAHPVERSVAYALADAFVPLLQAMPRGRIEVLARGSVDQLATLFPMLGRRAARVPLEVASSTELFWSFAQVIRGIAAERPLLLVLDDLQWADASSLDLLHFLARHITDARIAIVCAVNTDDPSRAWRAVLQSLTSLEIAASIDIMPLSAADITEMARHAGVAASQVNDVSRDLFQRTRGNPFFAEEILKQIVDRPIGTDAAIAPDVLLPGSVREAVLARLDALEPDVRTLIERIAVIGTRASYEIIEAVSGLDEVTLVHQLERAQKANVLVEESDARTLAYDFRHPLLRETIYSELSGARRRLLHTQVALAMEKRGDTRRDDSGVDIAPHILAGDAKRFGPRACDILATAGEAALARFADREADAFLNAAVELMVPEASQDARIRIMKNLARARQRLGRFDEAVILLHETQKLAEDHDASVAYADTSRRIAVAHFHAGRFNDALVAYDAAIPAAAQAGDDDLLARTYIERGTLLQGIGRVHDAISDLAAAAAAAERTGSPAAIARAERALLLFHTLSGPAERARQHAHRAIDASEKSGDLGLVGTCHWAAAVLSGMTGNSNGCALHIEQCRAVAAQLGSPMLRLAIDEVAIEYAYGIGEWDDALTTGTTAIDLARSLNQQSILPRLLVWTSLVHLGRDDIAAAAPLIDEAWTIAVDRTTDAHRIVHNIVPAHIGRAALHLAREEFDDAIIVAERALAIVDETGYTAWAVHRLLPTIAEAHLQRADFQAAFEIGKRLRREASYLGNTLGLAWADTTDAFVCWLEGDLARAIELLHSAADALDAVPFVPDAARLRRQLAGRLAENNDRDGALRELRTVHDVFLRLGQIRELEKTRIMFREVGARPPVRASAPGAAGLTGRELEIVRLVAARKSNKAIARELDVSARTVTTHLSNIFRKLAVSTRGELTDAARSLTID
jgi:DNA-binding CsgD family transcriptional regulator